MNKKAREKLDAIIFKTASLMTDESSIGDDAYSKLEQAIALLRQAKDEPT